MNLKQGKTLQKYAKFKLFRKNHRNFRETKIFRPVYSMYKPGLFLTKVRVVLVLSICKQRICTTKFLPFRCGVIYKDISLVLKENKLIVLHPFI